MRTITITLSLTDEQFNTIQADATKYDYAVDSFLAQPIEDLVFDLIETTDPITTKVE